MGNRTRTLALGAAIAALVVGPTAGATASDQQQPSEWRDLPAHDFDLPAGSRCDFAVHGEIVQNGQRIRTLEYHDDGSPAVEEIVGPLRIRLTNEADATSIQRAFPGTGIVTYPEDGGYSLRLENGRMLVGLAPGDDGGPALLGLSGSEHQVTIAPDGSRELSIGQGHVEDLCAALGAD